MSVILIAQIIGISAMTITVLSMQCRSNRNFFICQELAGVLFMVSFAMLGAWGGAVMNLFGVIRPELLRRENIAKSKITLIGLLVFLILCSLAVVIIFNEKFYLCLLVLIAQSAGTFFMWTRNGRNIRLCQLFIVSPLWLMYNSLIPVPSIGGILTELINIVSVALALIRFRKIGFVER